MQNIILTVMLSLSFLLFVPLVSAKTDGNSAKLEYRSELNRKKCDAKGFPVINVIQRVVNDADSGVAGNYWALDKYFRHIQVWKTVSGNYCADVSYDGSFAAVSGQTGPGGTGTIGNNVKGEMKGGYRTTEFSGVLRKKPLWPRYGFTGLTDYECDLSGNCPGRISWIGQYFDSSPSYDLEWWGWIYKAGKHGTWINEIDGNSGNIL